MLMEYIGSTYMGQSAEIKKLFDESVKLHRRLDGKVGAAFSSSGNIAGETNNDIRYIKRILFTG